MVMSGETSIFATLDTKAFLLVPPGCQSLPDKTLEDEKHDRWLWWPMLLVEVLCQGYLCLKRKGFSFHLQARLLGFQETLP